MIKEWEKPEGDRIWLSGDFASMKTGCVAGVIEAGMLVAKAFDQMPRWYLKNKYISYHVSCMNINNINEYPSTIVCQWLSSSSENSLLYSSSVGG